ncbi:MAG TPA: SWIM zinc finger family protein [Acidimicrobiales bacterium]|nr:SWIM zinc finger family protein [Acidimicrobiales bacterium]
MGRKRWTTQQVLAQAPDPQSMKAARGLTSLRTWSGLGCTESLVFGQCQGSGKQPYQVTVDLTGPAYRCTCPSRKFPCKHGLALLLLWVEHGDAVADAAAAADFAGEWAADRAHRTAAERARDAASGPGRPGEVADPEARARRQAEREATMSSGLDELERWLGDLVRQGLAAARRRPYAFWDEMASRLVDAQMPGLAERVREISGRIAGRQDWADILLTEAGRWQLAVHAWRSRERLDPDLLGDLRVFLGWHRRGDEVATFPRLADQWIVAGVRQDELERIVSQRTWLWGETTHRWVLLLDFAAAGGTLRTAQTVGSVVDDAVTLYPGADPPRAALSEGHEVVGAGALPAARSVADTVDQLSTWLAANPWRDRLPVALADVVAVPDRERWWLQDPAGDRLPLTRLTEPWMLLALSGGQPATVVAEWEAGSLHPLAVAPTVPSALAVRTADPVPL